MKDIDSFTGQHRFLSNFYTSLIQVEGEPYRTVEHAYQAMKTLDPVKRTHIRKLATPGQAKRAGRLLELRPDWESIKVDVMYGLIRAKFTQNPRLGACLLATGDAQLIEGNDWGDRFWGVCEDNGLNWLGRILMGVREELRRADADQAGR